MDYSAKLTTIVPGPIPLGEKKLYSAPRLDDYGDLRDLTLGGSPFGTLDSGDGLSKRPLA
jgi:hypothetical protein